MTRYLIMLLAVCLVALTASVRSCRQAHSEARRMEADRHTLLEGVTFYRTKDSLSAASVERLTLTTSELKRHNADLARMADGLGVKLRRLESANTTATQTDVSFSAPLRDTTITEKAGPVSVPVDAEAFDWHDAHMDISGVIRSGPPRTIECHVQSRDTLDHFLHQVPRQFWFIKYGTKAVRMDVVSRNPHTKIVYEKYIELKK